MGQRSAWRWMGLVCAGAALLSGCGRPGGGVALVNIQTVAHATGYDQVFFQTSQAAQKRGNDDLNRVQKDIGQTLAKADAAKYASKEEHDQKMAMLNQAASERWQQATQAVQSAQQQAMNDVVSQFKAKVKPVAEKIAFESGRSVVIEMNATILGYEPGADITNQVIAEMPPVIPPRPATETPQSAPSPEAQPGETPPADGRTPPGRP